VRAPIDKSPALRYPRTIRRAPVLPLDRQHREVTAYATREHRHVVEHHPASPVARGTAVTLTATVTPAAAAGTVQFRNGGINLGDPVSVTTGTAMGGPLILSPGMHQLTATFNPSDPWAFTASTAPVALFEITDRS
jgi:hypothetical protein